MPLLSIKRVKLSLNFIFIFFTLLPFSKLISADKPVFEDYVKEHFTNVSKKHKIPGIAVALVIDYKSLLYQIGFANDEFRTAVTADTLFEIASITKSFTATALAVEVLNHNMHLNDPITKFLPQIASQNIPLNQVTLLNLATHTSSLPRVPPKLQKGVYTQSLLFDYLKQWTPDYPIGSHYLYSNLGFGLLGNAISSIEQLDYENSIQKLILKPLNMTSTFVNVPRNLWYNYAQGYNFEGNLVQKSSINVWPGGGALKSTSRDMLKFLEAAMELKGPPEVLKAMSLTQKPYFKVNDQLTMGLSWQLFTTKKGMLIIDKNGGLSGFSSYIGFIPEKKIGLVLLMNKGKTDSTKIGRDFLREFSQKLTSKSLLGGF